MKNVLTQAEILTFAAAKGYKTDFTVQGGPFYGKEFLAVNLKTFTTAFFLMDDESGNYTYSHTYNALNDKTTKRKPSGI